MINIKKIRPMANYMVVTNDVYTSKDFEGHLQSKMDGALKEFQKVIAVGPMVRNINVGDIVCVNPARYAVRKYEENSIKNDIKDMMTKVTRYQFNTIELDHKDYLLITDQDVTFVVEDYEEEENPASPLILPKQEIIA